MSTGVSIHSKIDAFRRIRSELMKAYSFLLRGTEGQALISLVAATGPEGTARSCMRGGSAWESGKGSSPEGVQAWNRLPRAVGMALSCQNSDIVFGFGWCCVEPGVGFDDPCRFLLTQDIL